MMTTGLSATKVSLSDKLVAIVSEVGVIPFKERIFYNSPSTKLYYRPSAIVTLLYCGDPTNRGSYELLYSAFYTDSAINPEEDSCATVDIWNAIGCVIGELQLAHDDPAEFLKLVLDKDDLTPAQITAVDYLRTCAQNHWPRIKVELERNLPALCRVQHESLLDTLLVIFPEKEKEILEEARKASSSATS